MTVLERPPGRRVPVDPAVCVAFAVVHFDEAVLVRLPAARARLVWLVELLRASERAERWVRGPLRAIERPELVPWPAAGLIAMVRGRGRRGIGAYTVTIGGIGQLP